MIMDDFSSHQDLSLNLLTSLSTKIFNAECIKHVTSENYVENLNRVLSSIDDSWIEHCCSDSHASTLTRTECSQRLVLLSSLHTLFEQSCQGNSSLECVGKEQKSSIFRSSDFEKQVSDLRARSINVSNSDNVMKSDENYDCLKEIQERHGKCEDASRWYQETVALLLQENTVIAFMLQLFQSTCTFMQHLAKKVIISCVTCNKSKITIVLQHIERMLSCNFDSSIKMFDLLKELMSICDLKDNSTITRQTYEWFINHFESKSLPSLSKSMSSSIKCKKDENSNLISFLSFIKKITKYGNCNRDKINLFYIPHILNFLLNNTSKNMLEEGSIYQPIILKILKILNLALNLDIVLEKSIIAIPIADLAVQIVKHFPSLFFSLSKNYLSMNKSFWGTVNPSAIRIDKNIHSVCVNYSMARQLLVLSFKSCLFSSLSESYDEVNVKDCAYQTYDVFKTWFLEEQKAGVNESDWFSALLGEEDDQWITVLLCLLLIYTHLKRKPQNAISSSEGIYASQPVEPEPEHQCHRTKEFWLGKSSSSSHVNQTPLSCFDDPLSPHKLFLQFVNFIAFDHLVIADFLLSPETNFLAYFSKYISLLNDEWKLFYENVHTKETDPNEKKSFHFNVKSLSHPQVHDEKSKTSTENTRSECYSLSHERTTYNHSPSVPSKNSKIQHTVFNTSVRKKAMAIEPPDKRIRLKSRPDTISPLMSSSDVDITYLDSGKKKLTNISSLVSYTDSEDSENEASNSEEIVIDKPENLTPGYKNSLEIPKISEMKAGDTSENETIEYFLTIPDDRKTFQEHSNLYNAYNSHDSSNDYESEQESVEETEEGCELKSNLLDQFMTMLIRLQLHIDRLNEHNLIPYNVSHLLNLLNLCIEKYECDDNESFH